MKKNFIFLSFIYLTSLSNHAYCQLWKQYADSANAYHFKKNTDKAIEFYILANGELKKDSAGTNTYAQICDSLGDLLFEIEKFKEAEKFYLEVKPIKEKLFGKIHADYITSCNKLGSLYKKMRQYEKSESFYLESKQILEKILPRNRLDYANVCNNLSLVYLDIKQYKKAEPLLLKAKEIYESAYGRESSNYAVVCLNLAVIYYYLIQYNKAEPLFLEAIQIKVKIFGKQHAEYTKALEGLGILYTGMRQYEKAEILILETKQINEKLFGKDHPKYANSCFNLGNTYYESGQFMKAEKQYLEAKQIQEKIFGKNNADYAQSCYNLAVLYSDQMQFEKAERLFTEAKQIQEKIIGKENDDYLHYCNGLATIYHDMGQYENGETLFLEAKQICEKTFGKESHLYAQVCNNLALLYRDTRHYEKSETLYLEALHILEITEGKENNNYAVCCNNLAALYKNMGQIEKQEKLLLEARKIAGNIVDNHMYPFICGNLADLYVNRGQYEKAKPLYLEAKQLLERKSGKQNPDYRIFCVNLACYYWLINQPLMANQELKELFIFNADYLNSIFLFTNEKEKTTFVRNKLGEDDIAYSFYLTEKIKSDQPYSLSLFHRNLILSSLETLKKQLLSTKDSSLISKYNEWVGFKRKLAALYSKPIEERIEDIIKIEEKTGQLEKDLVRLSPGFKKQQEKADWKDIKNKLQADEASIEFASFHLYNNKQYLTGTTLYVALVLRKNMLLPATIRLFSENQLSDLLSSTANKKNNEGVTDLYTSTRDKSLYNLIWRPLEKELIGVKTVYFAPSGLLHRISFAAIPLNNNEVLSDRYKLVQLTTTASVTNNQTYYVNPSDKIQLYGGINYDADSTALKNVVINRGHIWAELEGTQKEIEAIKTESSTNYTVSALSGINATEESMQALDGKNSPAVLHIASHGFFFPDPKDAKRDTIQKYVTSGKVFKQSDDPLFRSGILFAGANNAWSGKPIEGIEDGILTAYEVSNMYLPNTKLVVLSACETALGDIQGSEGVYGLQRAFKMAGAQNLVMSLWKVPDAATAEFMQLFYKNLFAKQTISNAFYDAQQVMKNKYRNEPYKWAAWVLVR